MEMADDGARGICVPVEVEEVILLGQKQRRDAEDAAGAVQVGPLEKARLKLRDVVLRLMQHRRMVGAVDEKKPGMEIHVRRECGQFRLALHVFIVRPVTDTDELAPPRKNPRIPLLEKDHVRVEIQDVLRLGEFVEKPQLEKMRRTHPAARHRLLAENPRLQPRAPPHTLRRQLRH